MADKVEITPDGKAKITKDTGETVELTTEELLKQRPDLVGKMASARAKASVDVHAAFRDELHPLKPGPIDIGDLVFVKTAGEFGEVHRKVGDAYRVCMASNGRVETRWGVELERRT